MFRSMFRALVALLAVQMIAAPAMAQPKKKFTLAVSVYTGWMPWYYAKEEGIIKKWGDKYNVDIDVQYLEYGASIDNYTAGKAQAVVITNMDALQSPAVAGIDGTFAIVGDFSNGNDGVAVRGDILLKDLLNHKIYMVDKTVSVYLTARAAEKAGLDPSKLQISNVANDSDVAPGFLADRTQKVVATWNPMLMQLKQQRGVKAIFDSSEIPGEILDCLLVNTATVKNNPDFVRALTGAWYEVMATMSTRGEAADKAIASMATLSKCSPTEFRAQLKTTAMYYDAADAAKYTKSEELKKNNDRVRQFCFTRGWLGDKAKDADYIGIQYPDGTIQGSKGNIKLRFSTTFMDEHAKGLIKLN